MQRTTYLAVIHFGQHKAIYRGLLVTQTRPFSRWMTIKWRQVVDYIYIYKNKNIYYLTNQHIFLKIGKHSCSFVFDSVFVALFSCSNVFSDSDASCCGNFRPSPTPPPPFARDSGTWVFFAWLNQNEVCLYTRGIKTTTTINYYENMGGGTK